MMDLQFRRPDGSFVATLANGWPYHITEDDPLFQEAQTAAEELGDALPFEPEPEPTPLPPANPVTSIIAAAELGTVGGEVTGIESASGIGFAMMISDGVFWLFFSNPQPNANYLPFAQSSGYNADVTTREADYLEVTVTDRATNQPAIPASLAITVQRTL